jgi:hypothetical protein
MMLAGCVPQLDFSEPMDGSMPDVRLPDATLDATLDDARAEDMADPPDTARDMRLRDMTLDRAVPDQTPTDAAVRDAQTPDAHVVDAAPPADMRPDARLAPDQAVVPGPREVCDAQALDDDGDGRIDEGDACADYLLDHCHLSLGISSDPGMPDNETGRFGTCPDVDTPFDGNTRCVTSAQPVPWNADPVINVMLWDAPLGAGQVLAIRFACDGPAPPFDRFLERACKVRLAVTHQDPGGLNDAPPECRAAWPRDRDEAEQCVHTDHDTQFHPIWLEQPLRDTGFLGLAWRCENEQFPDLARGLEETVAPILTVQTPRPGAAADCREAFDTRPLGAEPCRFRDDQTIRRCVEAPPDESFDALNMPDGFGCFGFGVGLRRRR